MFREDRCRAHTVEDAGATAEISRFDAENATSMTIDFLERLGYKGKWLPLKVSLDGELYVVEMGYKKRQQKFK